MQNTKHKHSTRIDLTIKSQANQQIRMQIINPAHPKLPADIFIKLIINYNSLILYNMKLFYQENQYYTKIVPFQILLLQVMRVLLQDQ